MGQLQLAVPTSSLGKPEGGHAIETILKAAAEHGIKGIEVCYEGILSHAVSRSKQSDQPSNEEMLDAAKDIKQQCQKLGLTIFVLQPFASYEGLLDPEAHRAAVRRWSHWLDLAQTLGCDIIQMPSNFELSGTTGDIDRTVADMVEIADMALAASPQVRIAYEAVAWGTHFDLWEQSWEVAKRVNRSNFGLCLDTYHIAARVWADPERPDGKLPNGDQALEESLHRLVKDVDLDKVYMLQLSDTERLSSPLVDGHPLYVKGQKSRMTWSRNARLFPCEEQFGGHLPLLQITRAAVNELGYRSWISMETFSRHLREKDVELPATMAKRAADSYAKVFQSLEWDKL
ncbi:hypothetical protein M409DRAFT_37829 [Zasmidium cellare ATCC 36951]|uniref:Xylose isomerase-like TIM barrel domain-containing protein n=1 Tax=Zasmidium cellare ATCC 36951 TaxID=1080233 RepID=A0A6A6BZC0_ZASCE|nr:uncharacterized protein M409DRAFT_37829 [Zasmidium cellare ATCC 36951]KAF2159953.1 hypothetical protein M409DRAFT_37829 [Zasmidium cellare ATCC 36951]